MPKSLGRRDDITPMADPMKRALTSTTIVLVMAITITTGTDAQTRSADLCLMNFAAAADSSPAVVYGHTDLRDPLPRGVRELRITHSAGHALQRYTLRLVERGLDIQEELLVSWPTVGYHRVVQGPKGCAHATNAGDARLAQLVAQDAPDLYGCQEILTRGVFQLCQARFRSEPQWSRIMNRLEGLGVWTLPDPAELTPTERLVVDGHGFSVELRDDAGFRQYAYRNPDAQPWPEARAAEQIDAIVLQLLSGVGNRP